MTNIELKANEIKNEMRVDEQGRISFSLRGAARLIGLAENTLISTFSDDRRSTSILAKKLIENGFDLIAVKNNGIPDLAMASIIEYYAFDAGAYCKEEAKLAYRTFATVGIRAWGQKVLGWKPANHIILQKLDFICQKLESQEQELKLLRPAYEELQTLNKSFDELNNLKVLLEDIAKVIDKPNQQKASVREWLKKLNLDSAVSGNQCRAIGRMVTGWLKVGKMEQYANEKKYPESLVPLIKLATKYQLFHAK